MKDYRFLECNRMTLKMFGCEKEEDILGSYPWDFSPLNQPDGRSSKEKAVEMIDSCLKGKPQRFYWKHIQKDGREFDAEISLNLLETEEINSIIAIVRDITVQIRVEEALRKSAAIIDTTSDAVITTDIDGVITFWNKGAERIYGYKEAEALGRPISIIYSEKDLHVLNSMIQDLLDGRVIHGIEVTCVDKDRKEVPILLSLMTIKDADGNITELVGITKDIKERKKMEEDLRRERDKAQKLLDIAGVIFLAIDTKGDVTLLNRKGSEVLGYDQWEIIGKNWFDNFIPASERHRIKDIFKRLMAGEMEPIEYYENHVFSKSRGERLIAWHNTVLRDDKNNITGSLSSGIDITESKQAEEALRESERKYKELSDSLPQVVFETDIEGVLTYVSRVSFDLFGYTQEDFDQGLKALQMVIPEDRERALENMLRVLKGEILGGQEYIARRKDGKTFPVIIHSNRVVRDGKPTGLRGIIVDLSLLKQAEDAVRESEARLRVILDSVGAGIIIIDAKTHEIIDANATAVEMIGDNREVIIGSICHKYICPAEIGRCPITDLGQKIVNSERTLLRGSGAGIPVLKNISRIVINGKEHLLESFIDITERKKLEFRLQQAQKMEAIGTLAGGIAHDFNNLLSPIMIHSEMAMMQLDSESPIQNNLRNIYRAGERARDLVKQILTFARRSAEEKAPIRISPILKETVKFLRSTIPSTINIQYQLDTDDDIVLADPTQIHQVVMNLCTNAAYAMRGKDGILKISLVNEQIDSDMSGQFVDLNDGHYLKMSVSDTGSGIPADIIDKVFEPYFTTKAPGEGTGMGLAVVHGIVQSYGGFITVDSEPGRGTTFNVFLPVEEMEVPPAPEINISIPRGTECILLVDDEKMNVEIIQAMLESLGYKVTGRTSSIEALEAFRNKPHEYDLVITDMTMPNMTGKELARELMVLRPDIPVILCTGFSEQIDEERAKSMGISAFIMKPIVMHDIAVTIREILDKRQ